MNLAWVKPLIFKSKQFVIKNAPGLLMGMGSVGTITSLIFAIKATPAAWNAHADAVIEKTSKKIGKDFEETEWLITSGKEEGEKLSIPETIKTCGKFYIPAAGLEVFSLLCFWGAHGIDVKRQAVLAGLYSTAEEALREYQRKMQESIGKDAEKAVRTSIAQDRIDKNPPPQNTVILNDDTDLWCLIDGQYFRSSYLKIKEAQNDANHEMIQHMYISQQDLYWLLDPEKRYLRGGPNSGLIGWNVDDLLILDIESCLGPEHKPCLSISYKTKDGYEYLPKPGFCNFS